MADRSLWSLLVVLATAVPLGAADWQVDPGSSLLAVVTHKTGFAAGLAHDHLVAATRYVAHLELDPGAPVDAQFELHAEADALVPDLPELQRRWYPRLAELGILTEPFSEVSDKDRRRIRAAMLGSKQLDVARFPSISAQLVRVREEASASGEVPLTHQVTLELRIRGKTVERPVAARYSLDEGILTVEALGHFSFTEFGIKPYSAALGAVKNQDRFQVYVYLSGRPQDNAPTDN
jgi:hypothetical protein